MINYKKLAKGELKNATIALQRFVGIDSVYDEGTVKNGQPYGAGVKRALDYLAKLGEDYGFKVDKCDGYCTELSFGEEGPLIGIYGHSDVVPVSGAWSHPEFGGEVKDGRMWGRGTCDDKGPLLASLYALKGLKDRGLIKGFRVKLVSGGDEERGSSCLSYYFKEHNGEEPKFGFTPDANWPLIYAEKGIRRYEAARICDLKPIIAMDGGLVGNAVCDKLVATVRKDEALEKFLAEKKDLCDVSLGEGADLVSFKGKAAHGSTPELGVNAALLAFKTLGEFYRNPFLLSLAASLADPNGKSFGGYERSPELGDSTYNYGIVKYDGKVLKMSIDFRYGETAKPDILIHAFEKKTGLVCNLMSESPVLLFDKTSALVSTLLKAFRKATHSLSAKPLAIGGGTYAKEAKNTVAFGAEWKGHPGNMHGVDEYIYMDDFEKDIAIYARAIYMLGRAAQ
ncbi:MAG: Sapep family Mn(2+)-dependent dipeptidase [Bacilli bacterium]|jgi:succinyl-diaminopimelate desuccinylase|nr:Sapep family Mn(2+)-dependent dipeptidase [Bacilli bacterium]